MAFFRRTICITERNDRLVFAQFLSFYKYFWRSDKISYQAINIMSVCVCIVVLVIWHLVKRMRRIALSFVHIIV
jgi:hypothetical protein